jgi:RNA ligase (TIGR02306 family)
MCVDVTQPAFSFLGAGHGRIKTRRFRGVWSQGLLLPVSDFSYVVPGGIPNWREGDDVMEALGITRYEPPEPEFRGKPGATTYGRGAEKGPEGETTFVKYELENYRRHSHLLPNDAPVVISEKIHGCNARYRWANGRLYAASRTQWKPPVLGDVSMLWALRALLIVLWNRLFPSFAASTPSTYSCVWWRAVEQNEWVERFCRERPHLELHGEVYGHKIQDIQYGAKPGQVFFRAFDVRDTRTDEWLSWNELQALHLPERCVVPHIVAYAAPDRSLLHKQSAEDWSSTVGQKSALYDGPGEGVVIKDARRMKCAERIALKFVSDAYLERA